MFVGGERSNAVVALDGWHDEMPDDTSDDADDETFDRLAIELVVDELLDVVVFEIITGGSGARRSLNVVGRASRLSLDVETEAEAAESDCDDDDDDSNFSLISLIL